MIAITGATGQLGRLTIESLLNDVAAEKIVAIVRNPESARDLAAKGVTVRRRIITTPLRWSRRWRAWIACC